MDIKFERHKKQKQEQETRNKNKNKKRDKIHYGINVDSLKRLLSHIGG